MHRQTDRLTRRGKHQLNKNSCNCEYLLVRCLLSSDCCCCSCHCTLHANGKMCLLFLKHNNTAGSSHYNFFFLECCRSLCSLLFVFHCYCCWHIILHARWSLCNREQRRTTANNLQQRKPREEKMFSYLFAALCLPPLNSSCRSRILKPSYPWHTLASVPLA